MINKKTIYRRYTQQKQRCSNPNVEKYSTYGAKGIRVEYSFDELFEWFQEQYKQFSSVPISKLSIGRVDHSKNYSLDNIKLETVSNNSKERNKRLGTVIPPKKVLIKNYETNEPVKIADSVTEAAVFAGDSKGHVARVLSGSRKSAKGYSFEYWTNQEALKAKKVRFDTVKRKPVLIKNYKTGKPLFIANSLAQAAKLIGDTDGSIARVLKGKRNSARGYSFEYHSGVLNGT